MNIDEIKILIQKELDRYAKDKTKFKPYTDCIRDLNNSLKEMKK